MPWNYGVGDNTNESVLTEIGEARQLLTEVFNRTGRVVDHTVRENGLGSLNNRRAYRRKSKTCPRTSEIIGGDIRIHREK